MENMVKEPAPKYNYISPEEYLTMERASEERHEYYSGYVEPMGGASLAHNYIQVNLISEIANHLKEKECLVLPSHMRVGTPSHDSYMYPDVLIVCGKPELEDEKFDTLLNPSVIFEILSPSTYHHDKRYKFWHYQQIPSLKEFIMIESRKRLVQVARRQKDGAWKIFDVPKNLNEIHIETIGFTISFDSIYRNTGL
jgi:Uma2 family endonuclease